MQKGVGRTFKIAKYRAIATKAFSPPDTYEYAVVVPDFLSRQGNVRLVRLDNGEAQVIDVGIDRWHDEEYTFHISIIREEEGDEHYFIVNSELQLYYLNHWSENYKSQVQADFNEHREEIQELVDVAMAMWPFIK